VSRCAGRKPASVMMRRSSSSLVRLRTPRGVHHVFLNQNAADVVGAKLQANLANLDARREPTRLNVIDVVEIQAADRERLQIIDGGGFLNFLAERGIFRCENPGDERREATGLFLQPADPVEMIHAGAAAFRRSRTSLWPWCAGRANAPCGGLPPSRRWCTSGGRSCREFRHREFPRPPPGMDCSPASIRRWIVSRIESSLTSAMHRISGAEEAMQVNLRVARFQRSKKIFVIADLQVGMQTALKQKRRYHQVRAFLRFFA